ncbi:serine hydrolase domain-containing protein [Leeuwenhoekiella sp. NPDC079379]|uniref:serine hydrolase domain-containing protein n=1 Tax=Leeuwenhoekiella sp. NPDC079379 TaxID=3364122 RepID=UPI0037CC7F37
MRLKQISFLFFILLSVNLIAQDMAQYTGNWEGKIANPKTFSLTISIENTTTSEALFKIVNDHTIVEQTFQFKAGEALNIPLAENLSFTGNLTKDKKTISGFIQSGLLLYHLDLIKTKANFYTGIWNLLMLDSLKSQDFYLSVENGIGDSYEAYPILGDDRFTGTWCANFSKENNRIFFTDFKTGMVFKGTLLPEKIELEMYLGDHLITVMTLSKSQQDWKTGDFKDIHFEDLPNTLQLTQLETLIAKDSLPNTHSVVISKKGKRIYETYFKGYTASIPHDMRSASKSISSAIVGIAKDQSLFKSVNQSIFDFLPETFQNYKDTLKAQIDLQSLLTMSSGLDAIDYGLNANPESLAVEDKYQPRPDWTKSILEAQMIYAPNTHANYGSANPYLLGVAIDSRVSQPLELFIDRYLFQPLEISNYIMQTDLTGRPYFGGGMYLTPLDMLKFGELYLHKGRFYGKQIISKKWVENSLQNYRVLENTEDKNGYGYFWWHHTYTVNSTKIDTYEARGAGGQYIFILPKLEVVVVLTSGNYRNGKTQQPESILEHYILPYLLN